MIATLPPPPTAPPRRFDNAAEWLRALGGVPLERIIFDPWPGTATEADLLRFVERDKRLCELIDGTLVEKPVGYWEALIAMNLATDLGAYVKAHGLGALTGADSTMRMASTGRIRLPDLCFVSAERLPRTLEPVPTLAPDLAVEVLSVTNTADEMAQKLREYFGSGTRLAWLIDPATRTVAVYHGPSAPTRVLDERGTLDGEQVIPGFTLPVASLFLNVPPAP
jgi:Uma2 family endonuclease